MRNVSSTQATELMTELNEATTAMMGMVGTQQMSGPLWVAASVRQVRSFGRWNTFIKQSEMYGRTLG
jgi:hypothetical protein